jgi:replication fork protection complex subunit Tof1/Swi1
MTSKEPIDVDTDEDDDVEYVDRRTILAPAIYDTIAALGGHEGSTYVLGDEAYGCLKDLKKYWRKDDTDDERTVARIFWEARVLPNDLVPIIFETAGKGRVEDKCAIACADIVTAMTWPIDMAEELKELDEELDKGTDYTQLLQSHLHYKAALLRPGVIQALLGVMLPCIAKDKRERKERDGQIVNVILHLFRNLAFIKDVPPNIHASSDQAEFSTLQSRLIETMSETHVFDLLLTMASNAASDPFFNQWNTLIMEIFYLLFRGVTPQTLSIDQTKVCRITLPDFLPANQVIQRSQGTLSRLLEEENKIKLENARKASSRHSRFGTTISVKLNSNKSTSASTDTRESTPGQGDASSSASATGSRTFVLHRQRALNEETGNIFDMKKRKMAKKTNKVDELSREENLLYEAKVVLRGVAKTFVESCLNGMGACYMSTGNGLTKTCPLLRSLPFITSQGHQIRAPQDHGEGPHPTSLPNEVVPRVLPRRTREPISGAEGEQCCGMGI